MSGAAWATYLPAERAPSDGSKPRGASIFARDFQTVVIYDTQGKFVGVRRPGSGLPIEVWCLLLVVGPVIGAKPIYGMVKSSQQTTCAALVDLE